MLKEFGQDLKKLRESKDISLAEISAQSRINQKFLANIEEGNFDFQPETYIRSFLKAYARALDENENTVLTDYDKAKSGFYARRKFSQPEPEPQIGKLSISVKDTEPVKKTEETVYQKDLQSDVTSKNRQTAYEKLNDREDEDDNGFSNKTLTQKIFLGILIVVVIAGVVYLVNYLNTSGDKKNTTVKPKTFNEISDDYENKISGKKKGDSTSQKDSLGVLGGDSLKLMIKAAKDVRVKVYLDEKRIIEEDISGKDSLLLKAKDQFRFSANSNANIDLYLNGRYLKKPVNLPNSSIKNIVIKKDGIVNQ